MKKSLAIIVCLVMIMSMSITAFATDSTETKYTLTINNPTEGHEYEAHQIFSGVLENVNHADGSTTQVLTNIQWGSAIVGDGYDNSANLLNAIDEAAKAAKEANDGSLMSEFEGVNGKDAAYLAEKMADTFDGDSKTLADLANIFAKYIEDGSNSGTMTYGPNTEGVNCYTISDLSAGYYLIKDKDGSLDQNEYDSYTRFILRVIEDTTVSPKSSVPSVDKTISDAIDGEYDEYEDFNISDTAYYKWEGKLPSTLEDYDAYYYKFNDTLPQGIEFERFENIYIEDKDGNVVRTFFDAETDQIENLAEGINVEIEGKKVNLEFKDLKKLYPEIVDTDKIIVKYSARVTKDALIADPMTNSVYVEYSNNPNADGSGSGDGGDDDDDSTGKTPEDVAHAFTFQINVDKYDSDDIDKKLEGAEFKLYCEREVDGATVKYYAQVVVNEDGEDVISAWTTNKNEASVLDTDSNGAIAVRGLDKGTYYLLETKAPDGYNLMKDPVKIEINPTYNETGDEVSVTENYIVDSTDQGTNNTVAVGNSTGSSLPITGGMGTIIFYALGFVLVIGAVVLLVVKRRLS